MPSLGQDSHGIEGGSAARAMLKSTLPRVASALNTDQAGAATIDSSQELSMVVSTAASTSPLRLRVSSASWASRHTGKHHGAANDTSRP